MKLSTFILGSALLGTSLWAQTSNAKEEGIHAIKMLGSTLKSELKAKLKEDPTGIAAAGFCKGSAGTITKEINAKLPGYVSVRRTALKTRNPNNKADTTDINVMQAYNKAIQDKTFDPKTAIKVIKEGDTTRVYKPLLVKGACLKCHGTEISPQISELIHAAYPDDKAIGFKEGDFRGVIVAEVKKH